MGEGTGFKSNAQTEFTFTPLKSRGDVSFWNFKDSEHYGLSESSKVPSHQALYAGTLEVAIAHHSFIVGIDHSCMHMRAAICHHLLQIKKRNLDHQSARNWPVYDRFFIKKQTFESLNPDWYGSLS